MQMPPDRQTESNLTPNQIPKFIDSVGFIVAVRFGSCTLCVRQLKNKKKLKEFPRLKEIKKQVWGLMSNLFERFLYSMTKCVTIFSFGIIKQVSEPFFNWPVCCRITSGLCSSYCDLVPLNFLLDKKYNFVRWLNNLLDQITKGLFLCSLVL